MKTEIFSVLRRWRRHWRLKSLVLGTTSVGIAVFLSLAAVVDALLLRQPFAGAERVVKIDRARQHSEFLQLEDIERARAETGLPLTAMWEPLPLGRSPDAPMAAWVSTDFFEVVGVHPLVGRTFALGDEFLTDRAVIGERLWRTRFGADQDIAGRSVLLGDRRLTVLGVVASGFSLPLGANVWIPRPAEITYYSAIARLPPGMDAKAISSRWPQWSAVPIRDYLAPRDTSYGWVLLASSGLILVAACAYFGLVQVGEISRRFSEVCVRLALGAARWRAIRPVVTDASLGVVLCAVAGLLLAPATLSWVVTRLPPELVTGRTISIDWRTAATLVMILCTGLAMLTALTLAFCFRSLDAPAGSQDARLARGGGRWTRVVVTIQLAVVTPVLYLLGLSALGFHAIAIRDLGYRTQDVLSAEVPLWSGESTIAAAAQYVERLQPLLDRVAGLPGVRAAAFSDDRLGWVPTSDRIRIRLQGTPEPDAVIAQQNTVSGAYFRLLGIRCVTGEVFRDAVRNSIDWKDIYGGVVVDTTLAAVLGKGDNVVGRRVIVGFSPTTVLGVVEAIRSRRPDEPVEPRVYLRLSPNAPFATNLLVRFAGPFTPMAHAVGAVVQDQMGTQAPTDTVLLADELKRLQSPYRGLYELATLMAWVAAILCVSGMFAVMSDVLARRRKEVAVRLAVGASAMNILRLCLADLAWAMPTGIAAGFGVGVLLCREATNRLYGVAPTDPVTLVGVTLLIAGVVLSSAVVPIRQVLRTSLWYALRGD